jgi:mutator protein MutT
MQNLPTKKVIASVIKQNGKFLIAQRAKQDSNYGKWEFPGGKMEEGETEQECLQRELFEEFGIKAKIGNYLCSSFFEHKGDLVEMRAYVVSSYSGELQLLEHQQIAWVKLEDLASFDMPDPDKPIVAYLVASEQ